MIVIQGTSPISHDESKESRTPPVVLYQKDSMESESPEGQSPAKSSAVQSPLHIGDDEISSSPSTPYELDSNSRIAALEAEIVTLKNYIERLEEQVAKSRNNRFLCFS